MTPAEFKDARRKLGYSCAGLAREWGMGANGHRTIRRWEHGDVPVNPIAAYCIGLMLGNNDPTTPPGWAYLDGKWVKIE